jgi:hypothetical protein
MPRTPTNHYQSWTVKEIDTLMRLLADGTSSRDIAKALGRTRGAVTAKANAVKKARDVQPASGHHAQEA